MQKLFGSLFIVIVLFACQSKKDYTTWSHYKGSPENIHYSSLTGIDTANVKNLQVAWVYHTGDADTVHSSQIQCNPIVVDEWLYGTTPQMKLFAVNAATRVMGKIQGERLQAYWYNPRNGETKDIGAVVNKGSKKFDPPSTGYGHDWILIVDDIAKQYPKP